jgi:prophage antirepressor-like protein
MHLSDQGKPLSSDDGSPRISSFEFQHCRVRVALIAGSEYFIAKDLAPILGYAHAREAVRSRVDKRDRITVRNPDANGARGNPVLLAVNESGLYALIFGSKKPAAVQFTRWVTSEVLPTLRRTGRYETSGGKHPALMGQVIKGLCGRGVSAKRQLERIIAHRDGRVSLKVGGHWVRRVEAHNACGFGLSHRFREGLAVTALHLAAKAESNSIGLS